MKINDGNLKQMLPEYTPPERVWESVVKHLDGGFYDLPEHTPGPEIWDAIETKLRNGSVRHRRIQWWLRGSAAAAIFGIIAFPGLYKDDDTVRVTQEMLDGRLQISEVSEADSQYEEFMEICLTQAQICRQPDFDRLREEFEILRQATSDLRSAAGTFNRDRTLVEEHASLELKKAEILNEMVKFI